jgi:hypothetical protein
LLDERRPALYHSGMMLLRKNSFPLIIACVSFVAGWFFSSNSPRPVGKIEEQNAETAPAISILSPRTERSAKTDSTSVHEHPGSPSEPLTARKAERLRFEEERNVFIESAVASGAEAEEGEFRKLFEDLGLPDEKVKQLLVELKETKRTILAAELAIGDTWIHTPSAHRFGRLREA